MNDIERRNGLYEALAWGCLFLWLGIVSVAHGLPAGADVFGIGAILVVLNLARRLTGIRVNRFTLILGAVAATCGAVVFTMRQWFGMPPFDMPFWPTLLFTAGIVIVAYAVANWRRGSRPEEARQ